MGVVWYFGGMPSAIRSTASAGLPYMPMANNSNFLVDQNHWY